MQKLYFLHGACDVAQSSDRYYVLKNYLAELEPLSYKTHDTYNASLDNLLDQVDADRNTVFIGESFGGFWAAQLAYHFWARCVLLNPVVYPALQMQQFAGCVMQPGGNPLFAYTLKDYAMALDPRPRLKDRLILLLGENDTLLDPVLADRYFYDLPSCILRTKDEHAVTLPESFRRIAKEVKELKKENIFSYWKRRLSC